MKTQLINQVLTARGVEEIFINRDNKCWYLDMKIFFDGSAYSFDDDNNDNDNRENDDDDCWFILIFFLGEGKIAFSSNGFFRIFCKSDGMTMPIENDRTGLTFIYHEMEERA